MSYCTQADLIARFGEQEVIDLTAPGTSQVDASVLALVFRDADAEIDTYLRSRYQLPLDSVPVVLVRLACNVARYYLYNDNRPDLVTNDYKEAIRLLKEISSGRVSLGAGGIGSNSEPIKTGEPASFSDSRIFNKNSLADL